MHKKIIVTFVFIQFAPLLTAETLLECSKIEDASVRVTCYDKIAGRIEEKMDQNQEGTTKQIVQKKNQSIAEEIMGNESPAAQLMTFKIKKILRDRNRRITYVTVDGRRFRRSTSATTNFTVGDTLRIEEGFMGAIFLVRDDGRKIKAKELP